MGIRKHKKELGFVFMIAAIFLIWAAGRSFNLDTQGLQQALERYPLFLRGLIFIALYVVVTFFAFFSKDLFWLAGALLFGALESALLISAAEVINAFILFNLSRILGRAYVGQRLSGKYEYLDERLGRVNFFWLFLLRAVPLVPYRFLDLAAGLTRLSFRRYLAAVVLGTPLKTYWMQYILAGVGQNIFKDPESVARYLLGQPVLFAWSLFYLGLVIVVSVKWFKRS